MKVLASSEVLDAIDALVSLIVLSLSAFHNNILQSRVMLILSCNLIINCFSRSGRRPAPHQQEGVTTDNNDVPGVGVVSTEGLALKELKERTGTGLNAL